MRSVVRFAMVVAMLLVAEGVILWLLWRPVPTSGKADTPPLAEVDLGRFVASNLTEPGTIMRLETRIIVELPQSEASRFRVMLELHPSKLRDSISTVLRHASIESLRDPGLERLRADILRRVNETSSAEEINVHSILLPEFKVIEF